MKAIEAHESAEVNQKTLQTRGSTARMLDQTEKTQEDREYTTRTPNQ